MFNLLSCGRKEEPALIDIVPIDKEAEGQKFREARVTAIALALIALFLAGFGLMLMGVGTTPSTMTFGFGIFPYLIGSLLGFLSVGVVLSSVPCVAKALFHYNRA